jgi:DNA-binding response OmpR family regulator
MKRLRKYTALVVDDDLESLDGMVDYFSLFFAKIYKSSNAKDALELMNLKKPNIIFTDVQMPKIDGFSFISKIKDQGNNTPIVIISAYDDKEKLLKAIKLDIVDYLIKPLASQKLKNSLNLCIKKLEVSKGIVRLGDGLFWDKETNVLLSQDKPIKLTPSEIKLLKILIESVNIPVDGEDIFYYMWGDTQKAYNPKNVRNIIYSLRKKLESFDLIQNIYGSKYVIRAKEII